MNAVATPTKATAKKRAAPPATLTTAADPIAAMFRQLSLHLRNAAFAEEDGDLMSGHSVRLLRMAASVAGALGGEYWAVRAEEAQNAGYDIASMVIAALKVEQDRQGAYALGEIKAATSILSEITGDNDTLEGALDAHCRRELAQSATPPPERFEPHPLFPGLIGQLRIAEAMTMFAFKGVDGEDNPGSTPNGLLDMAADHMAEIISSLQEKHSFNESDQTNLLFALGRFEHLIQGAIGAIERESRLSSESGESEDFREGARLEYLDELITHAEDLHRDCDMGLWTPIFREATNG